MGDAADDMFDVALREQAQHDMLRRACPCQDWHWFQNEDGFYECRECGAQVDV
jgi:hypothetical protein